MRQYCTNGTNVTDVYYFSMYYTYTLSSRPCKFADIPIFTFDVFAHHAANLNYFVLYRLREAFKQQVQILDRFFAK